MADSLRIVFISREHAMGETGGGIGTYTTIAARALANRGHKVAVVTRGREGVLRDAGVEVVRLEHPDLPVPGLSRLWAGTRTARTVARRHPDVVQAAEWNAEGWWSARFTGVPLVTRLATPTYLAEALNRGSPDASTALLRRLERDQARRSAALVAPSRAIADRVATDWRLDPGSIVVIPNPVDADEIRRLAAQEPPLALPPRYIAFTGRLERRKGVHVLADALPEVLERHPDLSVVLVGHDPAPGGEGASATLRERTAHFGERVRLVGKQPRAVALAIAARAELVVLPSLWEAFGFVAAEALALGRPVVTTSGSGLAEVVEEGRGGWLVPPGDARALAAALDEHLGDPAGLEEAAKAARARADEFAPERIAARLDELYRDLVGRSAPAEFDRSIYRRGYRRHFRPEDRHGPFHRIYEDKRRTVVARLSDAPRGRLLDAGGGPGRLAAPLARAHDVTVCDISPEMLTEARARCPPDVRLVEADARALPFDDATFDYAIALDLLCHLPSAEEGLRELARVVRPGGRLLFDTTNAVPWWVLAYPSYVNWRPGRLAATLRSGGVLPEWRRTVRHDRPQDVEAAAAEVGLEVELVDSFGPPWTPKWHLWQAVKPAS